MGTCCSELFAEANTSSVEMFQKPVQVFPVLAAPGPYNVGVVPRGFKENPLPGAPAKFPTLEGRVGGKTFCPAVSNHILWGDCVHP